MTEASDARPRRLIILDFQLLRSIGHYLNFVVGFVRAAEERGFVPSVFVPADADPEVLERLNARALLPASNRRRLFQGDLLEDLPAAAQLMATVWRGVESAGLSCDDILLFAEANVLALFDLPRWLGSLDEDQRPAVFVRFLGSEIRVGAGDRYDAIARLQRFLGRLISRAPGSDRVFFTINTASEVPALTGIAVRRTFLMPMPKYYGDDASQASPPRIASRPLVVHINVRVVQEEEISLRLAEALLAARADIHVVLKFGQLVRRTASADRPENSRLRLVEEAQTPEAYLAMMHASDIVVLPYSPDAARGTNSGVFCEAAAFGKVVVAPTGTWMAEQMESGLAAGVLFRPGELEDLTAAVLDALNRHEVLAPEAGRRAGAFRAENSCARNLDRMIEMAGQTYQMNVDTLPGGAVDFAAAFPSRQYLVKGWSFTEEGAGVWTDGDEATLLFRVSDTGCPLCLAVLATPFVSRDHPELVVSVTINDVVADEWTYSGERKPTLRSTMIPPARYGETEVSVRFQFRSVKSPSELGLSADRRRLGLKLRQITFSKV